MLERYLIEHCSPTLASLKTANLFRFSSGSQRQLEEAQEFWNRCLSPKGVSVAILRNDGKNALFYVYRKQKLRQDLSREGVSQFLRQYGYHSADPEQGLARLRNRFDEDGSFPHEIGLFLGYPLGDVVGFIQNDGKNSKCSGCWKVYCDECQAVKTFQKFKKCREVYSRLFHEGRRTVDQLTVAA